MWPQGSLGRGGGLRIVCLVGLLALGGWLRLAGAAEPALRPEELLARVQQRYDRTTHLRAYFRQETRLQAFEQVQSGEGQVWILKPGMMRWDYTAPEHQVIIANGETLWIYMPEERQAIRDRVTPALGTQTPALFLAGQARLTELFRLAQASPQSPGEGGMFQLELKPKEGTLPYTEVQLGVDPASYLVTWVQLLDTLGNRTTMWFSDIDTQGPVAPSLFQFQVPPGVDVIAPGGLPAPR